MSKQPFVKTVFSLSMRLFITIFFFFCFVELAGAEPAPRTEEEERVISIYEQANKAVVNVEARMRGTRRGNGSGVIIDNGKGFIITNYHVIAGAEDVFATVSTGETAKVEVIGLDPDSDLALLKAEGIPDGNPQLEFGETASLRVGQKVLAIGNPFGLERTLSTGIISSLGRSIRAETARKIEDVIQIDADINPGNSGGPLLDMAGRLIGINTAITSTSGSSAGIGLAIPVEQVKRVVPLLVEFGKVLRPRLGIEIDNTRYGPVITKVAPGSPADKAGLQGRVVYVGRSGFFERFYRVDEIIVEVNGVKVRSKTDVIDQLDKVKEGDTVTLKVNRNGEFQEFKVKPQMI